MKERILAALKIKFKNLGFTDKAFEGVAEYLATTVTEEAQIETAIGGVEGLLKAFQGDVDKRVNDAIIKAKSEQQPKGGEDPNKGKEPVKGDEEAPAWAKSIIESNKTLADKLNKLEGENISKTRQQQLDAIVGKLPETLRKPYSRISLNDKSEDEFKALLDEVTTEVEGLSTELGAKSTVFNKPLGGGHIETKEPSKEEVEEVVSQMNL